MTRSTPSFTEATHSASQNAVRPADHARDRDYSTHAVIERVSAEATDPRSFSLGPPRPSRDRGEDEAGRSLRAASAPNGRPTSSRAGLECDGTQRILWRQFANGGANESDENSPALATISRHGVARCVSSSLLRHHISPSDNTARTALLTLSVRRAGVLAGLVLVFRRSAEPRTGSQSVHKSCTGRAGTGRHSPVRAGRSITKRQLRAHELDVDGRTGPLRRNSTEPQVRAILTD